MEHGGWLRLQRFAAASIYSSYLEASNVLGINGLRLSVQIRLLERDLGSPLLIRADKSRSMSLTKLGKRIVAAVHDYQQVVDHELEWLRHQIVIDKMRLADIARAVDVSTSQITYLAKDCGIELPKDPSPQTNWDRRIPVPTILQPAIDFHGRQRLERFSAACRYPTIEQASKALGINNGNLSTQILRLERDLGAPLLNRAFAHHPMSSTDFGEQVEAAIHDYLESCIVRL